MKILAQGKPENNIAGFQPVATLKGDQWIWWDESHTPAFDIFHTVRPDMFFGTGEISRAVQKCLAKYDIPYVIQTKEFTYTVNDVTPISAPLLMDVHNFAPAPPSNKYKTDVLCCGVGPEPDMFFMALCGLPGDVNVKLIGNYRWPLIEYAGKVNQEQKIDFINSSRIIYCQTMTEAAQALACRRLPVTGNPMNAMMNLVEMADLCFDDPLIFVQWCNDCLDGGDEYDLSSMLLTDFTKYTYDNMYDDIMETKDD